jgi:prepilin-type N-terminal cleavage/methylation domain-containing protein
MAKTLNQEERGFTLIEVMVVVLILAVLFTLGIVSYRGFSARADDTNTRAMLTNAAKAEAATQANSLDGAYVDGAALGLIEPSYDTTGATDESIHVVLGDVEDGGDLILADGQVLLYARSQSGTWFGIRLVAAGDEAGRHTCSGDDAASVSAIATCVGSSW